MTKKHYIQLAMTLRRNVPECTNSRHMKWSVVRDLCTLLKQDNPRFDAERFTDLATEFDLLPKEPA